MSNDHFILHFNIEKLTCGWNLSSLTAAPCPTKLRTHSLVTGLKMRTMPRAPAAATRGRLVAGSWLQAQV